MDTDTRHSELEMKFKADKVGVDSFIKFCTDLKPRFHKSMHVVGPDHYYRQGQNVVRHRHSGSTNTLTVKKRRSKKSILNRVEVDLFFAKRMKPLDIEKFLLSSGWKLEFSLIKDAHIFWFKHKGVDATLVIYDVEYISKKKTNKRRFIEVEIEKSTKVTAGEAKALLNNYWKEVLSPLNLGKPINKSLYEIYSGKSYLVHK